MGLTTTRPDPTVTLAVALLRQIAEDPMSRPSYRAAARQHLAEIAPPKPPRPPMAAEDDNDDMEAA